MTAPHLAVVMLAFLLVWSVVWLRREVLPARRLAQNLWVVPEGVSVGRGDIVEWSELTEVRVETTADGPWEPDLFLVLAFRRGREVRIPSEILPDELIERLKELPGFDYGPFLEACGCAERATFVCWRRVGAFSVG